MSTALIDAFLIELSTQRRASRHTLAAYRSDLQSLIEFADKRSLAALSGHDIRRYVTKLHAGGLSPASIARTLSAWRSMYRWLCERGDAQTNPVVGIRGPKRIKHLPKALSADQAVTFARASERMKRRSRAVTMRSSNCFIPADCGCPSWFRSTLHYFEAADQWPASVSWIDLAAREATVFGKGGKTRQVPIGTPACAALSKWLEVRCTLADSQQRALFVSAAGARSIRAQRAIEARDCCRASSASAFTCIRMCCGTVLRRICCNRAETCGRCRNYLGIRTFPLHRSTPG